MKCTLFIDGYMKSLISIHKTMDSNEPLASSPSSNKDNLKEGKASVATSR